MKFVGLLLLSAVIVTADMAKKPFEIYEDSDLHGKCNNQDLAVLNHCAKEVLRKLDQCGPDDLACECCALQSLKHVCYELCSDSFSSNFLNVLYEDCEPFTEVNACSFQFKEEDYTAMSPKKYKKNKNSIPKVDGSKIASGNRSESQGSTNSKVPLITKGKYHTDVPKNRSRDSTSQGLQAKGDSRVGPDDEFKPDSTYNHTNNSNTTVSKQDLSSSVRLLPKVLALMLGTLVSTIVV
ncbi:BA75_04171T0 [Komagataella pastoris]|uniref:BA75_04171T0 n=1 Tax=Komagataella pastoris TaxID=4922 RepID=A0A1B2JEJ0_PICPA|nr:BA75_04171T0 [Komagataella pastoris]